MEFSLKYLSLIIIAGFFSSCALHTGFVSDSASLGENNFTYVQQNVSGTETATYFFGFGGLEKENLAGRAKESLARGINLKDGQALANMSVNFKTTNILIYTKVTCTVTADIVQFKQ